MPPNGKFTTRNWLLVIIHNRVSTMTNSAVISVFLLRKSIVCDEEGEEEEEEQHNGEKQEEPYNKKSPTPITLRFLQSPTIWLHTDEAQYDLGPANEGLEHNLCAPWDSRHTCYEEQG